MGHYLSRRDERTVHLLKVLHKKCGDSFEAGILGGMRGTGRIEKINFDGSVFITFNAYENDRSFQPEPRLRLRMAAGFVRPIQMRRILRELSNIGVSNIDIVSADMCEKSYRDTKLLIDGGSHAALVEGAVQARDTTVPSLSVYDSLDKWLKEHPWEPSSPSGGSHPLFMKVPLLLAMDNERAEGSLFHLSPSSRPVVMAIGPERGWSDRERDMFEKAGFLRLSMGSRALRTETACAAAAMLAMRIIED